MRRLLLAISIVLALGFAGSRSSAAGATGAITAGDTHSPTSGLTKEVEVRRLFGLRADHSFLASLERSRTLDASRWMLGIRLSEAEQRDMFERFRLQRFLLKLAPALARERQRSFGGLFIDQAHGGIAVLQVTGRSWTDFAQLKQHFPFPRRLRIVRVRHTFSDLNKLSDRIYSERRQLRAEHILVDWIAVDVLNNTVGVAVEPLSRADSAAALQARYGRDWIRVSTKPRIMTRSTSGFDAFPDLRTDPFPHMRAGLLLYSKPITFPPDKCTTNFNVTYPGGYYVLTAGHCDYRITTQVNWYQGVHPTTAAYKPASTNIRAYNSSVDGSAFDGELLRLPGGAAQATNVVYISDTTGISITGAQTEYALPGEALCWSLGLTNVANCSHLVTISRTTEPLTDSGTGAQWNVVDQGELRDSSNGGDSGSPIWLPPQSPGGASLAVGILSASPITGGTTFSYAFKMSCCFTSRPVLLTYQP